MSFGESPKDKSRDRMEDTWFDMHVFKEKAKSASTFFVKSSRGHVNLE